MLVCGLYVVESCCQRHCGSTEHFNTPLPKANPTDQAAYHMSHGPGSRWRPPSARRAQSGSAPLPNPVAGSPRAPALGVLCVVL